MKVIAKISDNVVLCEVTTSEIARLHDCTSTYDKAWNNHWMNVGAEHDLRKAFEAMDALRQFDARHFKYVLDKMGGMVKGFEEVMDSYQKLMLFDTLKEAGKKEDVA